MAASDLLQSLRPAAASSDSHVILLKSLTDAGLVEMAVKHIGWLKSNAHLTFHTILLEFMASLSTAPDLQPVILLLQAMHAQGIVCNHDPLVNVLEGHGHST